MGILYASDHAVSRLLSGVVTTWWHAVAQAFKLHAPSESSEPRGRSRDFYARSFIAFTAPAIAGRFDVTAPGAPDVCKQRIVSARIAVAATLAPFHCTVCILCCAARNCSA